MFINLLIYIDDHTDSLNFPLSLLFRNTVVYTVLQFVIIWRLFILKEHTETCQIIKITILLWFYCLYIYRSFKLLEKSHTLAVIPSRDIHIILLMSAIRIKDLPPFFCSCHVLHRSFLSVLVWPGHLGRSPFFSGDAFFELLDPEEWPLFFPKAKIK